MRAVMVAAMLTAPLMVPLAATAQEAPSRTVEPLVPASGAVLEVGARGFVRRVPDLATVRAGVTTQAPTAAAAMAENADRTARVLAALRRAGVAERDLTTASVQLQPQYRYGENVAPAITGYQAVNSVAVRFRDVKRAGPVLDALVAAGANQIEGPNLSFDRPDAALDEARADAVAKARARADLYAKAAGLRVDRIVSISEAGSDDGGSSDARPMFRMAAQQASAPTQVLPGETEISATINVRFLLR
jgi:uncharacterized protein YggE